MVNRLDLIDASLTERLAAAGSGARREVARAVAMAAIEHAGLADQRITDAVAALSAGQTGEGSSQSALSAFVDELDTVAFDAQDRLDDGTGSEDDYIQAFCKARAATALLSVFQEDAEEAAADAIYEAYHAFDEDMVVIGGVIAENLE